MNELKGWPFEPVEGEIFPCDGEVGGGGGGFPG